jgi:WD40 repeat protein
MKLRIFLSSPGDLSPERERAASVIEEVDAELAHIELETVRSETELLLATSSFQDQIEPPAQCDLVVCILWKRLGTKLPAAYARPDNTRPTGTEYEFELAMEAHRDSSTGHPDILLYRKTAPFETEGAYLESKQTEYQEVESFWNKWVGNEETGFLSAFAKFNLTDDFATQFRNDLKQWIKQHRELAWDTQTQGSPFVGLQAFDEKHAAVFFGREPLIERAQQRLGNASREAEEKPTNLLVLGASGSGKSSLVRAGIVPRLQTSGATARWITCWRRLIVTPAELGPSKLHGLAQELQYVNEAKHDRVLPELLEGDYPDPDQLARHLESTRELGSADEDQNRLQPILSALDRVGEKLVTEEGHSEAPPTGLLLVIDQLEEVFQLDKAEQDRLLGFLAAAASQDRICVIATLRSDFYPRLHNVAALEKLHQRSVQLDVPQPSAADIREMVKGAAHAAGLELEGENPHTTDENRNLADELEKLADEPGALPALQFVLDKLYRRCVDEENKRVLTLAAFDELKKDGNSPLASQAMEIEAELGLKKNDQTFRGVICKLVDIKSAEEAEEGEDSVGGIAGVQARTAPLATFPEGSRERLLVDKLIDRRLLIAQRRNRASEAFVRVAHEQLLRSWPLACEQIKEEQWKYRLRSRLEESQRIWDGETNPAKKKEHLLTGKALDDAVSLKKIWRDQLSDDLVSFIAHSQRADRFRRVLLYFGIAALIGVLATAALVSTRFYWRADYQLKRSQKTQSRLLAQSADRAWEQGFRVAALHLAVDGFRLGEEGSSGSGVPESQAALRKAALGQRERAILTPDATSGCGHRTDNDSSRETPRPSHTAAVDHVAYGPSGRRAASGAGGGDVRLWDLEDCQLIAQLTEHRGNISDIAFGPRGEQIATASGDHTVRLWSAADGRPQGPPLRHRDKVLFVRFGPEGRRLLTGTSGDLAWVWDARTSMLISRFAGHEDEVVTGAFSPSGDRAATGELGSGNDASVYAWDLDGNQVAEFSGHTGRVLGVNFLSDGSAVASVSEDGQASLWATATGRQVASLHSGDWAPIDAVTFSPQGQAMAIGGPDGRIKVLDLHNGKTVAALEGDGESVTALAFAPDGTKLAATDESEALRVWEVTSGNQDLVLRGHTGAIQDIAYGSDGEQLLTAANDKTVRRWDVGAGPQARSWSSPDGRMAVGAAFDPNHERTIGVFPDHIRAWGEHERAPVMELDLASKLGQPADIQQFDVTEDGERIVTTSRRGNANLWNTARSELISELPAPDEGLVATYFSDAGNSIQALTPTGDLVSYSVADGDIQNQRKRNQTTPSPIGAIDRCRQDPDHIVLGYRNGRVERLRIGAPRLERDVLGNIGDATVAAIAFAPDCQTIALGDASGTVQIRAAETGRKRRAIDAHGDRVTALAYHPNGTRIATAGAATSNAKVWALPEGAEIGRIRGHSGTIHAITFNKSGDRVATASRDGTVRTAPAFGDSERLVEHARSLLLRPTNHREQRYFPVANTGRSGHSRTLDYTSIYSNREGGLGCLITEAWC